MIGQWIGVYSGSVNGRIMINIDETEVCYEAVAYIIPDKEGFPISVASFETQDKSSVHEGVAIVAPIDPDTGAVGVWDNVKKHFSDDIVHSERANIKLNITNGKLHLESLSDVGVELYCELSQSEKTDKSKIVGKTMSWDDFKKHISNLTNSHYLFRGQKEGWRLRTTFHRGERYRISQFTGKDVKQLHQRLSAITQHYFDLGVPEQNGAFFNLLQHHGYPTPLLDWSYSPYVSAFFAFRSWPMNHSGTEKIRIYLLDNKAWQAKYPPVLNLDPPFPHLSVMEFISIDNPRLVPQQAVTTVTNLDFVEDYILERQKQDKVEYITAIDIPSKEREVAMRDLRFMGITAGSMFPSIDGVCEELREKNFRV